MSLRVLVPTPLVLALLVAGCGPASPPRDATVLSARLCASCHGEHLTGARGPNLLDDHWTHRSDDASVRASISDGWLYSGMPAFADVLSRAEIDELVEHLRERHAAYLRGEVPGPAQIDDAVRVSERHAFRIETLANDLETPWGFAFAPEGAILLTERPGRLRVIREGKLDPRPVAGTPAAWARQDGGLLDVTLHPDFEDNSWIYLALSESDGGQRSRTVIVRGRIREHTWVDEERLFSCADGEFRRDTSHYGCRFLWDDSAALFFTIGDRGSRMDAQLLSSAHGKIHRIRDDGSIPPHNPFVGRPDALPSIWSWEHRHPQGLALHPVTGALWSAEHGPTGGGELNRIEPGRNYGWPLISKGTEFDRSPIGQFTERAGLEQPVVHWTAAIAPCGIAFYTGDRFPRWKNHLFVAGLVGEQVRRLETDGDGVVHQEVLLNGLGRVRSIATGPDGFLYILLNGPGSLTRLVPAE